MDYFTNLCRICMSRDEKLVNIYGTDEDMLTYIDKLNTCVPEIFLEANYTPLPDTMCEQCCKNLKISFLFRELCLKSNTFLRSKKLTIETNLQESIKQEVDAEMFDKVDPVIVEDVKIKEEFDVEQSAEEKVVVSDGVYLKSDVPEGQPDAEMLNSCPEEGGAVEAGLKTEVYEPRLIKLPGKEPKKCNLPAEYLCSYCGKKFRFRHDMLIHERIHTGSKPYVCPKCPKAFPNLARLKAHVNTHSKEKKFSCTICKKAFRQHSNLSTHMKLHTASETFSCTVCDKVFSQKRHLKQHTVFHKGERLFACSLCDWTFTMKHHLNRHMAVHTGLKGRRATGDTQGKERKFPCNMCEWSFVTKAHLQKHVLNHLKENARTRANLSDSKRQFPCLVCEWSFTKKHHLNRHLIKHESQRLFECKVCDAPFNDCYKYREHLQDHIVEPDTKTNDDE